MAVIDAGMSRRFSERFRAVTTISTRLLSGVAGAAALSSAARDTFELRTPVIPNARAARPTRIPTPRPARHNRAGRRTISLIISLPNRRFFRPLRLAQPRMSAGSNAIAGLSLIVQTFALYARLTECASALERPRESGIFYVPQTFAYDTI